MSDIITNERDTINLIYPEGVAVSLGWTPIRRDYKFGEIKSIDAADGFLPIWDFIGASPNGQKRKFIFSTDNDITHLVSTSDLDIGKVIRVSGLVLQEDGRRLEHTQNVTCNGQTPVALGTPLFRCTRMTVPGSIDLVGEVFIMEGDSTTLGVPDDKNLVRNYMGFDSDVVSPRAKNQTQKCIISTPSDRITLIDSVKQVVLSETNPAQAARLDIKVRQSINGSVFNQVATDGVSEDGTTAWQIFFDVPRVIPPSSDFMFEVASTENNASLGYEMDYTDLPCTLHNVRGYLREYLESLGYNFETNRYE